MLTFIASLLDAFPVPIEIMPIGISESFTLMPWFCYHSISLQRGGSVLGHPLLFHVMNQYLLNQLEAPASHHETSVIERNLPMLFQVACEVDPHITELEIPEKTNRQEMYLFFKSFFEDHNIEAPNYGIGEKQDHLYFDDHAIIYSPPCMEIVADLLLINDLSSTSIEYDILLRCVKLISNYSFNIFDCFEMWEENCYELMEDLEGEEVDENMKMLNYLNEIRPLYDQYNNLPNSFEEQHRSLSVILKVNPSISPILTRYATNTLTTIEGVNKYHHLFESGDYYSNMVPFWLCSGFVSLQNQQMIQYIHDEFNAYFECGINSQSDVAASLATVTDMNTHFNMLNNLISEYEEVVTELVKLHS